MNCLELFTGAGGLGMGIARAGFKHCGAIEFNHDACNTIRFNQTEEQSILKDWKLIETDTRDITDFGSLFKGINIVAGGPPCQPFSNGGLARGAADTRDMFPEAVRAIRQTQPQAFIFENVPGLLRERFAEYLRYIQLQLQYPTVVLKSKETVEKHHLRLVKIHTEGSVTGLQYTVSTQLLNAADYGVPQRRLRVFLVGFRSDVRASWRAPTITHSKAVLEHQKFHTREYFNKHGIAKKYWGKRKDVMLDAVQQQLQPWKTVRDAFVGLSNPVTRPNIAINHIVTGNAQAYPGHTGSPIDEPAKTLKAGTHGVPGGENMLRLPDNSVRYFTLREAARLQTFPDAYKFNGSWSDTMRQLGNAVPVDLATVVAKSVYNALLNAPSV